MEEKIRKGYSESIEPHTGSKCDEREVKRKARLSRICCRAARPQTSGCWDSPCTTTLYIVAGVFISPLLLP
jgi:hypothetical protein